MTDLSSLPEADQQAIADTLLTFLMGFRDRNADMFADVYSEDAHWSNVFGTVKQGPGEIIAYHRELFRTEKFRGRELAGPPDALFRVVTPEVVLVWAHVIVRDQSLADGDDPYEDNYSLRVLQRQADGSWRVISEMVRDASHEFAHEADRAMP